ncbi:ATP-binding cassette domain-containing protein [Zhihengliuella somnathii]
MTLSISHCSFRYSRRQPWVLRDLSTQFTRGSTILLGPNGAGKSTLLGLAAGVFTPSSGRITLGEATTSSRRARLAYRSDAAWMPQTIEAARGLTVRQQVALHGWLKGMNRSDAWEAALSALGRVELDDQADKTSTRLSGGQRARMGLAQALVHDASALILDEPTAALDPDQRDTFRELLGTVMDGRITVVSTHDVSELESAYEHVVVLTEGSIRFHGTVADFLALTDDGSALSSYRATLHGDAA